MDSITIDGLNEDDFRCSIESMLREGEADAAAEKLRALIEPHAGEGKTLPARLLGVSSSDFVIKGWEELGNRLGKYDRPGHWISAVGISIVDPSEAEQFTGGTTRLAPCLETSFYSDDAYPFSKSDRNDLLEGYTRQGAEWQGNFEQADMTLTVSGVEDLYEAIAELEARLFACDAPDVMEICAGSLAACYLSVLLHQAVRDKIRGEGLPRPLCVMTGCVGIYPFFDAPVVSSIECLDGGFTGMEVSLPAKRAKPMADADDDEPQEAVASLPDAEEMFGSLLSLTPRMSGKKMAIELDEEESAAAARQFEMASAHQMAEAGDAPARPAADYAAYAFDTDEEPSALDEDDDWADVPDGPMPSQSTINAEMNDWFGGLERPALDREQGEGIDMFPASDVAGPGFDEPGFAGQEFPHGHGAGHDMTGEEESDDPVEAEAEEDGDAWLAEPIEHAHPDAAYHMPPPQAVGHELRARLAHSLQAEKPQKTGLIERITRALARVWQRLISRK